MHTTTYIKPKKKNRMVKDSPIKCNLTQLYKVCNIDSTQTINICSNWFPFVMSKYIMMWVKRTNSDFPPPAFWSTQQLCKLNVRLKQSQKYRVGQKNYCLPGTTASFTMVIVFIFRWRLHCIRWYKSSFTAANSNTYPGCRTHWYT